MNLKRRHRKPTWCESYVFVVESLKSSTWSLTCSTNPRRLRTSSTDRPYRDGSVSTTVTESSRSSKSVKSSSIASKSAFVLASSGEVYGSATVSRIRLYEANRAFACPILRRTSLRHQHNTLQHRYSFTTLKGSSIERWTMSRQVGISSVVGLASRVYLST